MAFFLVEMTVNCAFLLLFVAIFLFIFILIHLRLTKISIMASNVLYTLSRSFW